VIILAINIALSALPEPRLFGMDQQTLLQIGANIINMLILAAFLAFLLYKPVRAFLKKRSDRVKEELEFAESEMAKATEMKLKYEQLIKDIEQERKDILDEARKQGAETGRLIVADAAKEADLIKERTTANIELEWERAQSGMRTAIIEISSSMAEKLITLAVNKETQDKLFDETMAELGETTWKI